MNVLYILDCWPVLTALFIFREMAWMKSRGHRVAVVSLESASDWYEGSVNIAQYGLEDVPCLQVNFQSPLDLPLIQRVIAFARQQQTQVIEAHDGREAADLARQVRLATGLPYAVRMHGGDVHSSPSPNLAHIVTDASVVCPVSQFLADLLMGTRSLAEPHEGVPVQLDPDKIRICHHGLPAEFIADEPAPQRDDAQMVGTICRLTNWDKGGNHITIEAVAGLTDEFPGLRLRIIGGGRLMPELQEQVEALGIADRVEITGYRPWPDVMKLARRLHIFVHGSRLEGFCLPTLEGAAQGVPLVLTRTGVHEECVESGVNGYLFDFGDVTTLRKHLRKLLRAGAQQRQRMGAATLRIVRERFVFEHLMPRVEVMLQAIALGSPRPM
jgi:glycosyltransferase involved in cell wall biosynthesis